MMNEEFIDKGYVKLPGFLDYGLLQFAARCYHVNRHLLTPEQGDGPSGLTDGMYIHPVSETLLVDGAPIVSGILGEEVIPTYSYTRMYEKGDQLKIHRDRPSCEVSLSLCIDYPSALDDLNVNPNSLFFSETPNKDDGVEITLKRGDACLYNGIEMYHWRDPIQYEWQLQVFLHYVRKNGKYAEYAWDMANRYPTDL